MFSERLYIMNLYQECKDRTTNKRHIYFNKKHTDLAHVACKKHVSVHKTGNFSFIHSFIFTTLV